MAREDPHFRLRLPAELKEKIERSAEAHGRSINAEIVFWLSEAFREGSVGRKSQWDDLDLLLTQFEKHQMSDREDLAEIDKIEGYLQSDAIAMQARLNHDPYEPSAVRPELSTITAKTLAMVIDHRAWVMSKAIRAIARSAREHEDSAVFAFYMRHKIEGDKWYDDILDEYVKEVDGLATPLHAADFHEAMIEKIRVVPDDERILYTSALDDLMPRLFKGWPNDWL